MDCGKEENFTIIEASDEKSRDETKSNCVLPKPGI
jgi:hypothetical protein